MYALYAKPWQPKIPVYIFPFKITKLNFDNYECEQADKPDLVTFWKNIQTGYSLFQKDYKELSITVNPKGDYVFN